ncbi:hypothetical protein [Virgibacillus necropolis]|uniref:Uncharacterized protein n=1 Tax=Virgibacillus necropolis TaxID=163877 RepID=A0A221M9F7_9BACI|nr:hypothetical protein [Virgibacillus necropolis]ASN04283.1 hypothetical protein CFK40_04295 [Virgibacillus necropolis]
MLAPKSVKVAVMQMMMSVVVLIAIFIPLIIFGLGFFIGVMIAVYVGEKPPLEAYEPYFEANISPSTEKTITAVRNDYQEQPEETIQTVSGK